MAVATTFFQKCVWLSLALILFNVAFSFVGGMGIFTTQNMGITPGDNTSSTFGDITQEQDIQQLKNMLLNILLCFQKH